MRYREKSGFEKKNIVLIMPAYNFRAEKIRVS
jgi:hypothetical protein